MRQSIRSSAFLMVLVPTLIPALALSAWFTSERVRDARAELEARGERESRYLARASELALLVGDAETLQRLAASNIDTPGAARAVLFLDNQHAVLAAAGTPWEIGLALQCWRAAADCSGGEQRRVFGAEVRTTTAREGGEAFGGDLAASPAALGSVVLSFDPEALLALQRALLRNAVLTTVAALLVAAIIASLFSRRLSVPMQQLSAVVARIRGGELGARTEPRGTGELRELEEGVNAMADRVEAASAELNRRIDEATSDLSGTMVELERQNRELDAALSRAEAAARAKDLFLARMSHELRTPLSTVTGFARLMQQSESPEQRADFYRPISQASRILQRTVDDILDFVRLESGSLHLERREFDFEGCVEDGLMMLAPAARHKGLDLVLHLAPGLPVSVNGDSLRLSQVLTNLVSNAIKFTGSGQVAVSVRALQREGSSCRVAFEVRDTGIGIAPENIAQLFQPFAQGDESMTRRFGGSGLGLSISASIVRALGGTIELSSEPQRGTRVCVELPLEEIADEAAPIVPRAGEVALLGNSDSPQLPVLRDYLAQGFERVSCIDADDPRATPSPGVRMLVVLEDRPGCVASRWAGFAQPLLRLRPVEVQLGDAPSFVDEVLPLPLRRRELLAACARLCDGVALREPPAATPAVPGLPGLRCLLVEDNELNRRMIAIGLRGAGVEVVEAGNGVEALQRFEPGMLDIALLDVHMPEMDGITLAVRLRELDPVLPLYALTANVIGSEEQALAEAGVREVLYKPVDEQRLHALLARHAPPGEVVLQPRPGIGAEDVRAECARLLGLVTAAFVVSDDAAAREAAHQLLGVARLFTRGALQSCCEHLEGALRAGERVGAADALLAVRQALRRLEPGGSAIASVQAAAP